MCANPVCARTRSILVQPKMPSIEPVTMFGRALQLKSMAIFDVDGHLLLTLEAFLVN